MGCFSSKNVVDEVMKRVDEKVEVLEDKIEHEVIPKLVGEIVIALLPRLKASNAGQIPCQCTAGAACKT
jgi:hypothetical protein